MRERDGHDITHTVQLVTRLLPTQTFARSRSRIDSAAAHGIPALDQFSSMKIVPTTGSD